MKAAYRPMLLKAFMAIAAIIVTAFSQTPSTAWYTGNPDAESFSISTADDLAGLAELVNGGNDFDGKTVRLVSDIDLSVHYGEGYNGGKGWVPIGWGRHTEEDTCKDQGHYCDISDGEDDKTWVCFGGLFDGNGKTVNGLYINDPELNYAGLFGPIFSGDIKDLGVVGARVYGRKFVGGLVGSVGAKYSVYPPIKRGEIAGCYVTGAISGDKSYVGGVVGFLFESGLKNSYFSGTVGGADTAEYVGGIAGSAYLGNIANCYSVGTVSGGTFVGGIAGDGDVANSYSTCAVSGSGLVGGIAGNGLGPNNAALNPKVVAAGEYSAYSGRVSGNSRSGEVDAINCVGYTYMTNKDGSVDWGRNIIDRDVSVDWGRNIRYGTDGVDIDGTEIQSDGTLGGRFTAEGGWVTADGFLPGFGAPVEMPAYLKLVNAQKPIFVTSDTTLPLGAAGATTSIAVETSVDDGGTLSYQWYFSLTGSRSGGTPIDGATGASYIATVDEERVYDYFVIVTNTIEDNGDGGMKTVAVTKDITITVTVTNAQAPTITVHPLDEAVVDVGETQLLTVEANVKDGGELSYQWYASATASNTGGTPIEGANGSTYAAPINEEGVYCYYVVVTNTIENNGDGGLKSMATASNAAVLNVGVTAINVKIPVIDRQPKDIARVAVGEFLSLQVHYFYFGFPEAPTGHQWYVNTTASNTGGTPIDGATDTDFTVPTETVGTFYYYVVLTNRFLSDNGDGGMKESLTASRVAVVKVFPYVYNHNSVSSKDRVIPDAPPRAEVAAISPISVSSSKFTVGPNPSRIGGTVNFFYSGSRINSGALAIYDASGNLVKKLKISGKLASGDSAARGVASWDLTDKKLRPVPAGTYLVKGVVSPSNGKRERVSVVVLVR